MVVTPWSAWLTFLSSLFWRLGQLVEVFDVGQLIGRLPVRLAWRLVVEEDAVVVGEDDHPRTVSGDGLGGHGFGRPSCLLRHFFVFFRFVSVGVHLVGVVIGTLAGFLVVCRAITSGPGKRERERERERESVCVCIGVRAKSLSHKTSSSFFKKKSSVPFLQWFTETNTSKTIAYWYCKHSQTSSRKTSRDWTEMFVLTNFSFSKTACAYPANYLTTRSLYSHGLFVSTRFDCSGLSQAIQVSWALWTTKKKKLNISNLSNDLTWYREVLQIQNISSAFSFRIFRTWRLPYMKIKCFLKFCSNFIRIDPLRRFRKRWRRAQILQFCGDSRRIRWESRPN